MLQSGTQHGARTHNPGIRIPCSTDWTTTLTSPPPSAFTYHQHQLSLPVISHCWWSFVSHCWASLGVSHHPHSCQLSSVLILCHQSLLLAIRDHWSLWSALTGHYKSSSVGISHCWQLMVIISSVMVTVTLTSSVLTPCVGMLTGVKSVTTWSNCNQSKSALVWWCGMELLHLVVFGKHDERIV